MMGVSIDSQLTLGDRGTWLQRRQRQLRAPLRYAEAAKNTVTLRRTLTRLQYPSSPLPYLVILGESDDEGSDESVLGLARSETKILF